MRRTGTVLLVGLLMAASMLLAGQASAQSGDPKEGRAIFQSQCAMCHGADASGIMGMHPSLRGAIERLTVEGVEVTIRKGRDTNPPMPAFQARLTDEEISDVIAYIGTLPVGPRNFGAEGDGMMGDMGGMMGGMGGWLMMLLIVVVVVLVVAGVAAAVARRGGRSEREPERRALDILDERFARGEINREEYQERLNTLREK